MPDGLTISVTADGTISAKDVAIGGNLEDLASARGQIGDARQLADLDFNMLTVPGFYRTTGNPKNGPIGISGASIGSLFVSGMQGNGNRLFQIMVSGNGIYWRTSISGGTTWEIWNQVLTGNKIGDGIRNTNGIISVPEMQGATSAQAGVSGLVPPPLAADAGKVLGSDGTWSFPKDVAIGGDLEDLVSARGQIGDNIRINTASDLNAYTKAGNWLFSDAAAGENFPNIGRGGELNCYVSTTAIFQFFTEFNNNRRYIRYGIPNSTWTNWIQFISVAQLGDGIRNTNGIISVPEYEGATASSAGTSGLVPPAAAGQQESFLTGGGEYKPALTKISDSVSLEDSTTAASAKAVKTAYDLASAALPKSGGTISGNISVVGGITVAAPDGESEGGQILLKNGTDGSYPVVIDTTQNQIRFLSGPGGPGGFVSVDLETVRFVGNLTGKADSAHLADNTYSLAGRPWLEGLYTDSPGWVIGSVDEQLRPINTGSLKVLAADRIISGSFAYGRASDGFYLPNGGSWFVFCILDNDVSHGSANAIPIMAAGGSHITWSFNGTGYTWIGIKI